MGMYFVRYGHLKVFSGFSKFNYIRSMRSFFNNRIVWVLVFCCSFGVIRAQQSNPSFSLQQALEYASEHSYQKISSNFEVISARKKIWETIASGLPQADFTARYNHSLDLAKSLVPIELFREENWPAGAKAGDKIAVSFSTAYDANYGIGVTQMIFDGSYFVGVQATKVFLDYTEQQQRKTEVEIRNSVAQAYFLVLSARENSTAFEENLKVNESVLADTKAMFQGGLVESLDVSQVELMVNEAKKRLMEVRRSEEVALAVLKFTMGLDSQIDPVLTDSLSFLTEKILASGVPDIDLNMDDLVEFQLAQTDVETQRLLLKNERVQYLPKISAFYNFQKAGYSDEWNLFDQEWYKAQFVGLQMSIPVFSSGMRYSKVQQQKLKWLKSQNEKEMMVRSLQNDYLVALTNMRSGYDQYAYSQQNRDLARDIYEKTRIKFGHGLSTSTELSQQQGQFIQSQMGYVLAAVNLMNAHIALLKATGQL